MQDRSLTFPKITAVMGENHIMYMYVCCNVVVDAPCKKVLYGKYIGTLYTQYTQLHSLENVPIHLLYTAV